MNILLILNDAPYGGERTYNGLRLALSLQKEKAQVRVFLLGDSVTAALAGQKPPVGYYQIGNMIEGLLRQGAEVELCTTCAQARGIADLPRIEGTPLSTLARLTEWTLNADKVLVF
ncbi:MAG: hypothetical protein A2600_05910 [Candidatus Lambdaproteobacteria bacterium RIFOXYD1_FULL_56_27]|uniref:Uncharacterized protein n=1 Tax=Candidatus Lambdaproteobacteria bacterium RIFOXYD2_FULL_56_26 TaxID=1817773 RepID=A0A1F6GPF4_9PROT|nr:MAG: hypothetical protein A2557_01425 [Candidatus Lambdaproteobacteria bacterium RIFOXYD2_FULL_56_26]OGH04073.1 MAG: hypothetical protein A2426_01470 [Candidatus Lambdaproteobacteria bacterium RIFOXYC1_FULL_56_13]OGH09818.1 MAG: hypothetical protein A2600_05910 [Candidatus Lambdaproteobacteria bacterium RIFOXYD1_FULL_56_27]